MIRYLVGFELNILTLLAIHFHPRSLKMRVGVFSAFAAVIVDCQRCLSLVKCSMIEIIN